MSIGENLKKIRTNAGITQAVLAEKIGISSGFNLSTLKSNDTELANIIGQAVTAAVSETIKQLIPVIMDSTGGNRINPISSPSKEDSFLPKQACRLETFPQELIEEVDDIFKTMIEKNAVNYCYIARVCTSSGYPISSPSVKRYFKKHFK